MFDHIFGIHERALIARGDRVQVLATNIANADTPNFKSRDYDFAAMLAGESGGGELPMTVTRVGHLTAAADAGTTSDLKYRIPFQPSLDGNTVEAPVEQAHFAENSARYQASLMFITRRIQSLELALTGQ